MKLIIASLAIVFSSYSAIAQQAKDIATETHKVEGNCNMCKKRIEDAAYVKGVKRSEWNKQTQELTVIYKPSKTGTEAILASIAKAGHSTDKIEATEADYKKLPECCQYKSHTCNH